MINALLATLSDLTWVRILIAAGALLWAWHGAKRWLCSGAVPFGADDARLGASVCVAACVTLPALTLGSFGWLNWPAWVAGVLALAALMHRRGDAAAAMTPAVAPVETVPAPSIPFVLLLGGIAVGLALFVLRNPVTDRDSLQYHLPMWAHWARTGNLSVALREPIEIYTAYPGGAEMLQAFAGWSALDDALAPLPSIGALVLLALVTRRIALRMGAAPPLAEAGALLLVSAHPVTVLGRGTQVDGLMTAWTLIALLFALRFRAHHGRRDMVLTLAALGLASGCRFTGPALAALVLLTALAWPPAVPLAALRRVPVAAWSLAALLTGYWMVRNLIAVGNPLYPAEVQLLGVTLPAPLPLERLRNTTQWAMWQQGFAGHLTPANVARFYGASLALAALGVSAPLLRAKGTLQRERAALLAFVAATLTLYVFSPFSGANVPSVGGHTPELAPDNVRYLLQGVALLVALGAAVLSGSRPVMLVGAALCTALTLWQLGVSLPRMLAGAVLVAPFAFAKHARSGAPLRPTPALAVFVVVGSIALAFALRVTAPSRAAIVTNAWQDMRDHRGVHLLDGAFAQRLRAKAGTRPIAFVGLRSSHQLTGGDFVSETIYLPVSAAGRTARGTFDWGRDDRTQPDQAAWTQRVDAAAPALLVLVHDESGPGFPEARWAANDTARFTRFAVSGRDTVYSVRSLAR